MPSYDSTHWACLYSWHFTLRTESCLFININLWIYLGLSYFPFFLFLNLQKVLNVFLIFEEKYILYIYSNPLLFNDSYYKELPWEPTSWGAVCSYKVLRELQVFLPLYWIKYEYFWSASWSSILHLWHIIMIEQIMCVEAPLREFRFTFSFSVTPKLWIWEVN